MLLIVFSSLFVEYINITATTTFMNGMMSRSVEKSCDYFAQETYKNDGATGDVPTIVDSKGNPFCSGTFYPAGKEETYRSLYGSGSAFANWYIDDYTNNMKRQARAGDKPMWLNLEILAKGLNLNTGSLTSGDTALGKSYVENMMSPLNLGIPYLDKDTVTKIAQWNLTYNLSEGFKERLHMNENDDASGNGVALRPYVVYHGFRVFTKDLKIDSIDYEVYDIRTQAGRDNFTKDTNMDATTLYGGEKGNVSIINNLDERAYIGVATINYTVPMQYVGVTPMRSIINFVQNKTAVKGYGSMENQTAASDVMKTWTNKKTETTYSSKANVQNMAIKNKLVYYIVR